MADDRFDETSASVIQSATTGRGRGQNGSHSEASKYMSERLQCRESCVVLDTSSDYTKSCKLHGDQQYCIEAVMV